MYLCYTDWDGSVDGENEWVADSSVLQATDDPEGDKAAMWGNSGSTYIFER